MNKEKQKVYHTLEVLIDYWTDSLKFYRFTNNEQMFRLTEENIKDCMEMRFELYMGGGLSA